MTNEASEAQKRDYEAKAKAEQGKPTTTEPVAKPTEQAEPKKAKRSRAKEPATAE